MKSDAPWKELCVRLVQSDSSAFEQIFYLTRNDLLRYVCSIVNDGIIAHDLVQDVFVSLWNLRESLDAERSLLAYIFRMARNRAYRHLRDERIHARRHLEIRQESVTPHPDDGIHVQMIDEKLHEWVADLPERQREALSLSRWHGLSHDEVASVMRISPRTVNNHIMRALVSLRERLLAYETSVHE